MNPIPDTLRQRPFTFAQARDAGVSRRMLSGQRFARVHPRVWRCADHELTEADRVLAARLAMPDDAHLTGITRLRMEGLDYGASWPVRFVVARDHHIALDGIFLHRTKRLPPTDDKGVVVEAAFIAYCATARAIDAIKVGDWLLHRWLMSRERLVEIALTDPWRAGADEARWVVNYLGPRCRSLMESETCALLVFAGLPKPEVNAQTLLDDGRVVEGDLVYRDLGLYVEYEGVHHQEDRRQYLADIARYASLRDSGLAYVQITKEARARPHDLVHAVHREMTARGYDGPGPTHGDLWRLLFLPLSVAVADQTVRFTGA